MASWQAAAQKASADPSTDFDAIIIGAGVSGLYQLYKLRELGLKARVFETGTGVGGTWYWNRYPGARFDSESYTYGYSFSPELLEEWDWAERFASQPETERYLNHVADRFDLRRDIQFKSRVAAAHYREETRSWDVMLEDGRRYCTRLLITAIGVLSAPTMPRIPGVDTFKGQSCHTHYWPKEGVRLRRQARRGDRHRRHRGADDPGSGQDRRPPDRVPAHPAMVRAIAQRQDRRRGDAPHPGRLSRDLRALRRHSRLLYPRPRPARHPRGDTARSARPSGKSSTPSRASASGRAISATSWWTARPMRWSRISSHARSASASRIRRWPRN